MLGTRESNRLVTIVATVVSFIFVTFLVVGSSRAAFSATGDNTGNVIGTGSITLVAKNPATAMFNVTDAVPGTDYVRCIEVEYTGQTSGLSAVTISRTGAAPVLPTLPALPTTLENYVELTIERVSVTGDHTVSANCTGGTSQQTVWGSSGAAAGGYRVGTLGAFQNTYAPGSGASTGWTPSGSPQSQIYRFTARVKDENDAQGKTATFGFQWEVTTT